MWEIRKWALEGIKDGWYIRMREARRQQPDAPVSLTEMEVKCSFM